ncbi:MAG: hypothetical protein AB7P32_16770 [Nitrospirales bacterium]
MTHFLNIEELEKEILYLQEQNQKLIQELSQVVKENHRLREELFRQKHPYPEQLEDTERKDRTLPKEYMSKSQEDEGFCLN